MNLLVTGGCGFIGSNFIHAVINKSKIHKLINLDLLTYAGSLDNVKSISDNRKYILNKVDLADYKNDFINYNIIKKEQSRNLKEAWGSKGKMAKYLSTIILMTIKAIPFKRKQFDLMSKKLKGLKK